MSKTIPAGSGETMQYMVHNFNDNTIRFILRYPGVPDGELLMTAAAQVISSVDVLHGSYIPGAIRAKWRIHTDIHKDDFFREIRSRDPFADAVKLALEPVSPDSRTQLRVALVHDGRESFVVFNVSHLVCDGGDARYLLEKLCQAYSLDSSVKVSVKNGSRDPEQAYRHMDKKTIQSLMKNPIPGVKTQFPYPSDAHGPAHMVQRTISREVMNSARFRAREFGASANDLLLAACYHALAEIPGFDGQEMSIMSMADLRRHCPGGQSEGLCNLSGSMPTVVPAEADFQKTLACVAEQTARAKNDPLAGLMGVPLLHSLIRTVPHGLLIRAAEKVYGTMSVGLTNLGNVSATSLTLGDMAPEALWLGGPVKKKAAMQVCAISLDGQCALAVLGDFTEEDATVMEDFLGTVAEKIGIFAEGIRL